MVKKSENCKLGSTKWGYILKNLLIATGIVIIILIGISMWLRTYTQHGEEVEVADIEGMYEEEAVQVLLADGLKMEVIDSTFSNKVPLGTIVEQNPPAHARVKRGRTIYIVVNAKSRKQVTLPSLIDMSERQAENILHQLGLNIDEVIYEPSEYTNLVLDVRKGEQSLEEGTKMVEGSSVTLVVGQGQGTEMVTVPDLRGQNIRSARATLLEARLTLGIHTYDMEPTEDNINDYVIYSQTPLPGEQLLEGSGVVVQLSTDLEKTATSDNDGGEEEFF